MNELILILFTFYSLAWGLPPHIQLNDHKRIAGGESAVQGQFPYQISISHTKYNHICGGSILNSNWILTAAHCIYGSDESNLAVYSGSVLLNSGGNFHGIAKIVPHPDYKDDTIPYNDVALLKLQDAIDLSQNAQPIDLETQEGDVVDCVVSGWGLLPSNIQPNNIQYVNLTTITNEECRETYPEIDDSMICTYDEELKRPCVSDSGGPLVANGRQIGIVSWGTAACTVNNPSVYAKVSSYVSWIRDVIESN